jgi:hypothetical protein
MGGGAWLHNYLESVWSRYPYMGEQPMKSRAIEISLGINCKQSRQVSLELSTFSNGQTAALPLRVPFGLSGGRSWEKRLACLAIPLLFNEQ